MFNFYDYVSDNTFFKKFEVDELLFVQYRCIITDPQVEYWSHNNYVVYILSGKKKWGSKDKEYVLNQGDALFVRKGAYTAERFDDEDFCALVIFLTDDFIKSVLEKYPKHGTTLPSLAEEEFDPIIQLRVDEVMSAYFHSVLSYFPQPVSPTKELLKIKFEELLLNILNSEANRSLAVYLRKFHQTGKVSIPHIMESSFTHNLSIEEYARLCARSLSTFKADFYDIYRTTPGKWLLDTRLHYAKCLIETSGESINDIALKSGFKNTTHFVRVFKERYSMPPHQYRLSGQRDSVARQLQEV